MSTAPSRNWTVPPGVPASATTVALSVTSSSVTLGFADATTAVVVGRGPTIAQLTRVAGLPAGGPACDQLPATPSKPSAEDSAPFTTIRVSSTNTPAPCAASSDTSAIDSSTWPPANEDRSNATSRQPPVDPVKEFQTPLVPGASQFVPLK